MHISQMEHMEELIQKYLIYIPRLDILDVGSYDVNGSYKSLFINESKSKRWTYTGADIAAGPNVDVVLDDPYKFPFKDNQFDLVISGSVFEHTEFFWLTFQEMTRVLKPLGYIFLTAPSRGPEHKHPVDCWRFYPDGFRALAKYCNLEAIEVTTDWHNYVSDDNSYIHGDTVGVFWKGK